MVAERLACAEEHYDSLQSCASLCFGEGSAAWPEDEPRDLAKFAAAVVVADAVHTEHAARQRFFVSGSELVALRCKLASLNFQAGRNSSWRVVGVERLSGLRNAVEQAMLRVAGISVSKAQLAASRGLRTRLRLPVDDALAVVGEFAVSRLEAEVAVSAALEAAHTSHLSCLRAVAYSHSLRCLTISPAP